MDVDAGALERTIEETLSVFETLTPEELAAPSACDGWSVHTTLAHVTLAVAGIAGLVASAMTGADEDFEAAVDAQAKAFAERPSAEVLELLRAAKPAVVQTFAELAEDFAAMPIPMGTAGTYSFGQLAGALTFDQTCHLRWDILAPRGPIERDVPSLDDGRVRATIAWLTAGIPQMTTPQFRGLLTHPLTFALSGPGASTFTVGVEGDALRVTPGEVDARAIVASPATDFVLWGTGREQRTGRVEVAGDEVWAAAVLDAFRVY